MKILELIQVEHSVNVGDNCGDIEPNILEDTLFVSEGEPVGFYLKKLPENLAKIVNVANAELLSERVPKTEMVRASGVRQFSTIIGGVPPKPHLRRPYASLSSVHKCKPAQQFIKAMLLAARESEEIIKNLCPKLYDQQVRLISENVPEKYRFGKCFTSSISNFNISAPFHRDNANIKGCVNVIIAKKHNATGGNTTIPDYNATVDSCDNSMLVYPAWRNVHGVTPIHPNKEGGYRNTLVFYPLKSFKGHK